MFFKTVFHNLYKRVDRKVYAQFGFYLTDATFPKIVDYMYKPKDSSSLAATRILFGLAMLFDIPDERGGYNMEKRWGDLKTCHFPLLSFVQPVPMPYMALVYAALWFGAVGIMLGYKYRVTSAMFTLCYWYLFLIEKSYWNNHSYLFGLVALLLSCTDAGCYWSIDVYQNPSKLKTEVPYWNYFVLKYQFFILYFMAGMKKGTAEWLTGYSVQNLSEHWVFAPFKLFLTVPQTDYIIVHWFVFLFDLTVAIWMMYSYTRHVAMILCAAFHLMNSRLFRIGMFPWVCLATMPLFYPFDWPKTVIKAINETHKKYTICNTFTKANCNEVGNTEDSKKETDSEGTVRSLTEGVQNCSNVEEEGGNDGNLAEFQNKTDTVDRELIENIKEPDQLDEFIENDSTDLKRRKITVLLIFFYMFFQAFLPYSHFITKGYNNWVDGLYGYSWDMMVHTWDTHAVIVKVVDNENNSEFYMDPYIYNLNDRWTRHGDMVHQYAKCLKNNLVNERNQYNKRIVSNNISIYVDVWCSMNGRFTQRLFDPKVDILTANWNPFTSPPYLMPLLDEGLKWREYLDAMKREVLSWNNYSDVIFLADFPGYEQQKYIPFELKNVSLTVLDGTVVYEPEVTNINIGHSYRLNTGDRIAVEIGVFHKVLNIGDKPAFYMYNFFNTTEDVTNSVKEKPKFPIVQELWSRFYKTFVFFNIVFKSVTALFGFDRCT